MDQISRSPCKVANFNSIGAAGIYVQPYERTYLLHHSIGATPAQGNALHI